MINQMIDSIVSRKDFFDFLSALEQDLINHPDEWENPTLDRFLEAMSAWIGSVENYSKNTGDTDSLDASWKTFAKILYAGKVYE